MTREAAITTRVNAADMGPWYVSETPAETPDDMRAAQEDRVGVSSFEKQIFYASGWCQRNNAEFIAHAREDVCWMLMQIEWKRRTLLAVLALVDEVDDEDSAEHQDWLAVRETIRRGLTKWDDPANL